MLLNDKFPDSVWWIIEDLLLLCQAEGAVEGKDNPFVINLCVLTASVCYLNEESIDTKNNFSVFAIFTFVLKEQRRRYSLNLVITKPRKF